MRTHCGWPRRRGTAIAGAYICAPLADDDGPKTPDGALSAPRVGFVSRLPVDRIESIRSFPPELGDGFAVRRDENGRQEAVPVALRYFERPILRAEVKLPNNVPLVVYVAHLKSRRPVVLEGEDRQGPAVRALAVVRALVQRAAEAAAVRGMLSREMADRGAEPHPVMVLGDLNDELTSVTTELIRGEEPLPESLKPLMSDPGDWQRKNLRLWDLHLYAASDQLRRATSEARRSIPMSMSAITRCSITSCSARNSSRVIRTASPIFAICRSITTMWSTHI